MSTSTPPKIFITGATGYVGGDVLYTFTHAHPEWDITCLVRTEAKALKISTSYPKVTTVLGELSNLSLLEQESSKADMVIHFADSNDVAAAKAIAKGLSSQSPSSKEKQGYFIHISGTGILFYPDVDQDTYGEKRDKVWDDVSDIKEIVQGIPHHALHREVDEVVLEAGRSGTLKTAIICPPLIYGVGRGPDGNRSAGLPGLTKAILERGKGFKVGKAENIWSNVHVYDLSDFFLRFVEGIVEGNEMLTWGDEGYYFTDASEHVWGELAEAVTKKAHQMGYIKSDEVDTLTKDQANEIFMYGAMMWGTNSRSRAKRGPKILGWKPKAPRIDSQEILAELIEVERKK